MVSNWLLGGYLEVDGCLIGGITWLHGVTPGGTWLHLIALDYTMLHLVALFAVGCN